MLTPVSIQPIFRVTELYTLYYFQHKSGYFFPGESHDFWEIIYVDRGRASGINGSQPYTLEKGQMIFHHPNTFHNFRTGAPSDEAEDCDIIVISFDGSLEMLEQFRDSIFTLSMQERGLFRHILDEAKGVYGKPLGKNLIYSKADPEEPEHVPGGRQLIGILLEQLLVSLYRKQRDCPSQIQTLPLQSMGEDYKTVRQIILYLQANIYNNISFLDLVNHFNISQTRLKTMFRQTTGYSVMQYYRKCVVARIEYHLQQKDRNFTELAELFHFSSIHYFSKFYKRETGHTLGEYLKKTE